MTCSRRSLLVALCGVLVVAMRPGPALAHAILLDGDPAPGSAIEEGRRPIALRFNSRVDGDRSTLRLVRADRSEERLPIAPDGPPDTLRSVADLVPGACVIRWQVLAVDGHLTRGEVRFTVTPRP